MKPWDDLTEAGQFRRMRAVAQAALANYPIEPTRLTLVGGFTNVIYRVETADATYALRIDLFQDHTDADAEIELGWIEALARDTDVNVGRPVRANDGCLYTYAGAAGVPDERRCTLFGWVPGRILADRLTPANLEHMGGLSAKLHEHGATWKPPSQPMAWDRTFYWPEDVDPYVIDEPEHAHHFDAPRRSILDRAMAAVEPAFAELQGPCQIVHGDLHLENVHVSRSSLWAIDFEDVMWARPVQDVAVSLYYIRTEPEATVLRDAFRRGYESVREWPEQRPGQIEDFIAARELMFVNFVLNVLDDPSGFFDNVFPRLEHYLASKQ